MIRTEYTAFEIDMIKQYVTALLYKGVLSSGIPVLERSGKSLKDFVTDWTVNFPYHEKLKFLEKVLDFDYLYELSTLAFTPPCLSYIARTKGTNNMLLNPPEIPVGEMYKMEQFYSDEEYAEVMFTYSSLSDIEFYGIIDKRLLV